MRRFGGAVWVCGTLLGCTSFEPGTDELSAEPNGIQAQLDPSGLDWSCLEEQAGEAPDNIVPSSTPGSGHLVASLRLLNLLTGTAIPGTVVRACAQPDVDCTSPLSDDLPVNANGWVDLPLYPGFDGYVEVRSETTLPAIVFFARPLTLETSVDSVPFGLVETDVLPSLTAATGSPQDPGLGVIWLRAFDCQGVSASGVSFSIDRASNPYYFVGDLPSSTVDITAGSGLGGFVNVLPGVAVVGARVRDNGRTIGAPRSLIVRGGWMSGVRFVPATMPQ